MKCCRWLCEGAWTPIWGFHDGLQRWSKWKICKHFFTWFWSLLEIYFKSLRCINGGIHCVFVFSKGIRARKASSQVTGPQHELNRSRNYYADLTAMNGTCFPPENVLYNFPMNFTAEVVPEVSNVEQSLSYGSINTFSPGNFW